MNATDTWSDLMHVPHRPVDIVARRMIEKAHPIHVFIDRDPREPQNMSYPDRIKEVLAKKNILPLPPTAKNLEKMTFGRMEVVAYSHSKKRPRGDGLDHIWVVRCLCGEYRMRYHQKISQMLRKGTEDMCSDCVRTKQIQKLASQQH